MNKGLLRFYKNVEKLLGENLYEILDQYTDSKDIHEIKCLKCGNIMKRSPKNILNSIRTFKKHSCNFCNKMERFGDSYDELINILTKQYGENPYIIPKQIINGLNTRKKINITCRACGNELSVLPKNLIKSKELIGKYYCPYCNNRPKDNRPYEERIKEIDSSLKCLEDVNILNKKYKYVCTKCGKEKYYYANKVLKGQKCIYCEGGLYKDKRSYNERLSEIHPNLICLEQNVEGNLHSKFDHYCKDCGEIIKARPSNKLQCFGCPKCLKKKQGSKSQDEILYFLKYDLGISVEKNNKDILDGYEIDIYVDSHKIGIEYNGLYWHSDRFREKYYHYNKTKSAAEKGIRLIHIFEDEWLYKRDIVKSRLRHIFNKTENIIYARKCEIREISSNLSSEFLEKNHLQGNVNARIRLGLFFNDQIVSVMTFSKFRQGIGNSSNLNSYELLRFCNKLNYNIVGGFSKLLKYFKNNYEYDEIKTYADLRWSDGNVYEKNGFEFLHVSKPNYFYTKGYIRESRNKYMKHKLKKLDSYSDDKTEHEIMRSEGYHIIYDCGNLVYILRDKNPISS